MPKGRCYQREKTERLEKQIGDCCARVVFVLLREMQNYTKKVELFVTVAFNINLVSD